MHLPDEDSSLPGRLLKGMMLREGERRRGMWRAARRKRRKRRKEGKEEEGKEGRKLTLAGKLRKERRNKGREGKEAER